MKIKISKQNCLILESIENGLNVSEYISPQALLSTQHIWINILIIPYYPTRLNCTLKIVCQTSKLWKLSK